MKPLLFFLMAMGILLSCNNESKPAETTETKVASGADTTSATAIPVNLPYTASYSSQFIIGDAKISEKILTLFKYWDDNKLADAKSLFGDSVHFNTDNWEFHGTRDSFMTVSQKERDNFREVKTVVHAWIPVHSTDKNEDWALVWSTGYTTNTKGKVDSASYQDTWRFNKNGQFDLMFSYRQRSPQPSKK